MFGGLLWSFRVFVPAPFFFENNSALLGPFLFHAGTSGAKIQRCLRKPLSCADTGNVHLLHSLAGGGMCPLTVSLLFQCFLVV